MINIKFFLPKNGTSQLSAKASPPDLLQKTHFVDATLKKKKSGILFIIYWYFEDEGDFK